MTEVVLSEYRMPVKKDININYDPLAIPTLDPITYYTVKRTVEVVEYSFQYRVLRWREYIDDVVTCQYDEVEKL